MEGVEKTTPEQEDIRQYRKNLLEITQFKAPEYQPRTWENEETKEIPLESLTTLPDPRRKTRKRSATCLDTENTIEKTQDPKLPRCIPNQVTTENQKTVEDLNAPIEGIVLHVSDSDLKLFPEKSDESKEVNLKEDCTKIMENRRVYLNNNWQVKDSIGSPAFQGIIEEDPNIDWLTFISENINF